MTILRHLKRLLIGKTRQKPAIPSPRQWKEFEETEPVSDGKGNLLCPNCGHMKFYEGPSGGLSTNVLCAQCGAWWNANSMGMRWQFLRWEAKVQDSGSGPAGSPGGPLEETR